MYVIKQWAKHFEINRSREIKHPAWVAMPNRHDTLGFQTLIRKPDGPALYGVWCILVQIASKCQPRGALVTGNGQAHTPESISIKTGLPVALIEHCLDVLQEPEISWIQNTYTQEGAVIPQEGAVIPQEGAVIPQEGAPRARATGTTDTTDTTWKNTPLTPLFPEGGEQIKKTRAELRAERVAEQYRQAEERRQKIASENWKPLTDEEIKAAEQGKPI